MNSIEMNKIAWEHRAYEFWNSRYSPEDLAKRIKEDPAARLRYHQKYFQNISGLKIANPCGSNGRIAVPLTLLGADVTVFDISKENEKYALELAKSAGVSINYVVSDFYMISPNAYKNYFDIAYMEGGILHYFHDIDKFMAKLYSIITPGGKLILSDFHPYRKIAFIPQTEGNYFDSNIHEGDVAYKNFFHEGEQKLFPSCSLRFYTLSEIINSVIRAGFNLREFDEHSNWDDSKLPGEFTIFAIK